MKKLFCFICSKYKKFEKSKIYLFEKILVLSNIFSRMKMKYLKKNNQLKY